MALVAPLFESVPPKMYGGTERVVYNLCRGLYSAGIDVTLFASGDSAARVRTIPILKEALRLSRSWIPDPTIYNFKLLTEVAKYAGDFDLIHNHHDYWMLPLSAMTDVPLLTTTHGRLDLPELDTVYTAFPNATFVSISDSQRSDLPQLNWMRTIHHGLDLKTFEFHPSPGKYLAFLGRISPEKHPEWAIEIAKKAGVPLKLAAKIEGNDGKDYFDRLVRPHVDGKFIEYVGEIREDEKSDFLGNALAMLFPIDWPEPFGLVMIESLACGTPVLARPCGAVPEILEDGVTGFLSQNLDDLAGRVSELGTISRLRCRQWVERRFSVERMSEEYIHVYRSLTAAAGRRAHPALPYRGNQRPKRPRTARHRRNILYPVRRAAHGHS